MSAECAKGGGVGRQKVNGGEAGGVRMSGRGGERKQNRRGGGDKEGEGRGAALAEMEMRCAGGDAGAWCGMTQRGKVDGPARWR